MIRRKYTPRPLRLVAWNCYVANSNDNVLATLTQWAEKYQPDVFALSEARTHAAVLDDIPDYTRLQETPKPGRDGVVDDTGDSALLIRNLPNRPSGRRGRVRPALARHRVVRMRRRWMVFSKRRVHTPRTYEMAVVWVDGKRWRIRADHWPTLGFDGGNREAFVESARNARRWLRATPPRSAAVLVGDLNETVTRLRAWFGKWVGVFGKHIDGALTRNVTDCTCRELGNGGSDHPGRLYEFTPKP